MECGLRGQAVCASAGGAGAAGQAAVQTVCALGAAGIGFAARHVIGLCCGQSLDWTGRGAWAGFATVTGAALCGDVLYGALQ